MEQPPIGIGRLIHQTDLILSRAIQKKLDEIDISLEQWRIIYTLSYEDGITQQTLSDKLYKDQTNVTRIVDKLEQKGFVKRTRHPEDRRAYLLYLTEAGQQVIETAFPLTQSTIEQILSGISAEEQLLLKELLYKIRSGALQFSSK